MLNSFLGKWEKGHQGYGVRDYRSSNYRELVPYFDGQPEKWRDLTKGRTLLMIHGTFSRAHGAFHELQPEKMAELERLYEGRVIAFDHSSISADPDENIDWLIDKIPPGTSLDLDIICHSRGGLVARSLTERPTDRLNGRKIRVHRTALVGTVNNGTILASVEHWNDLIDTLSTVINTVGFAVSDAAELVLAFVQDFAEAASLELRGLAAMIPGGPFLKSFNARSPRESTYLAIASNYEPVDRKLKSYFNDVVKDLIFERNENDCMVRVDSVRGTGVAGEFPRVEETMILDGSKGIEHSRYFGHPDVAARLVSWLEAGLAVPA
jgi:pimeloyl-ACP methyl ester carboxylesterase